MQQWRWMPTVAYKVVYSTVQYYAVYSMTLQPLVPHQRAFSALEPRFVSSDELPITYSTVAAVTSATPLLHCTALHCTALHCTCTVPSHHSTSPVH